MMRTKYYKNKHFPIFIHRKAKTGALFYRHRGERINVKNNKNNKNSKMKLIMYVQGIDGDKIGKIIFESGRATYI